METNSPSPVRVTSDHLAFAFDAAAPAAAVVAPGTVVSFETSDAVLARIADGESLEQIGFDRINPVTGPVHVDGVEPGDALRIEVLDIEIASAWIVWIPGFGPLGAKADHVRSERVPISEDGIELAKGLRVPLEPMIGCIGVAPADGTASTMRPVFPTGGNLDLKDMRPGAVLWLPVEVAGGLLSLGDLHAAMGNGEPAFVSIEAAGTATVRIDVEQASTLSFPRLRRGRETICVGMGESFPAARQSAVEQAFELLTSTHGLKPTTAYAYLCARVSLRPAGPSGSMVDGLEAVLAVVPDPE